MKKVIGYIRISTKDQSNFSLEGQEKLIRDYCEKQQFEIVAFFEDKGHSGKDFDRVNWKLLQDFVKKNYARVDYLVVSKYDRFSRNVSEALQMIEKLEKQYKGDKKTKVQGHLVIDENRAPYVKLIFENYLAGMPQEEIRNFLKTKGVRILGNSGIQIILNNPLYAGMVKVGSYYDEAPQMVKGIHEPLIDEASWWRCQALLNLAKGRKHTEYNEIVPLRGALHCHCNKLLTAGNSKGKSGKYYWYYLCQEHRSTSFNANKLHDQFSAILKELSLPKNVIQYLQGQIVEKLNIGLEAKNKELDAARHNLKQVSTKMDNLEEKYLCDSIDTKTYFKWKAKFSEQHAEYSHIVATSLTPISEAWDQYEEVLKKLTDLNNFFQECSIMGKHPFISTVFDGKVY